MAEASEKIMPPPRMKALLATSKNDPVPVAIALTADGEGLMLLHKLAKPKKVLGMLREEAAKAGLKLNAASVRFGRASVDTEYDSAMVRLFINKEAPGNMRAKLVPVVKLAAYQKVELNVDAALDLEPDDQSDPPANPPSDPPSAPPADSPPIPQGDPPSNPPGDPPPAATATIDAAALKAAFATQIGRLAKAPAQDPEPLAALKQLATQINARLKSGDLAAAAADLATLRQGLDRLAQPGPAPDPAPDPAALSRDLAGLIGQIARLDDAGRKAVLGKAAAEANARLKAQDFTAATQAIAALRQALAAPSASSSSGLRAALGERLAVCDDDLKTLRHPAAGALRTEARAIAALLDTGDAAPAAPRIDALETAIARLVSAARQAGVAADSGHQVEYGKLLLRWRDAQATFATNLKNFGTTLLARQEIQADPRLDVIRAAVAALPGLVPKFAGDLEDVLDAGISATDPAKKAALAADAGKAIDLYRGQLATAPVLAALEQFAGQGLGLQLPLHAALDSALDAIKQQLAG